MDNLEAITQAITRRSGVFAPHAIIAADFNVSRSDNENRAKLNSAENVLLHVMETSESDGYYLLVSSHDERKVIAELGETGIIEKIISADEEISSLPGGYVYGGHISGKKSQVDRVYSRINSLNFVSGQEQAYFDWDYEKLSQRFYALSRFLSKRITPDFQSTSINWPIADNCEWICYFCPESLLPLRLYTLDEAKSSLSEIARFLERFHNGMHDRFEIFPNANDITAFLAFPQRSANGKIIPYNKAKEEGIFVADPIELVVALKQTLPKSEKRKIGTFLNPATFMRVVNDFEKIRPVLEDRFAQSPYANMFQPSLFRSPEKYFSTLFSPGGINRLYLGIEILDDFFAREVLGKPVTEVEKLRAIDYLLRDTRVEKVKLIVQYGFGKKIPTSAGIVDYDQILSTLERSAISLAQLTKRHNNGNSLRLTVEVSRYQPVEGTKMHQLRQRPEFTDYPDAEREAYLAREEKIFTDAFRGQWKHALRFDYHYALPIDAFRN
ncbi:MAG: hypothetical protein HGA85_05505 [Nanoarchaeota archaeon]|nr:hypothetical protein [Nanoarchaeota archaeon]